jgi:hypothetical protein
MSPLSPTTRQHLDVLFSVGDRPAAERALLNWSEDSDRLRFAALRLSHGDLRTLDDAITLGRTDWRDLLVAAGFAGDIHAHEKWVPQRLTPNLIDRWRSGGDLEGVQFRVGSQVQVRRVALVGEVGVVETLEQLEPEPTYTIRFERGRQLAVRQCDPAGCWLILLCQKS